MSNRIFIDSSINNRLVTVTGTDVAQCSKCPNPPTTGTEYNPATHGASVYLKGGANNYIATSMSDGSLNIGTGDFTMSCWLYPLSAAASWGNTIFRWGSWNIYRITSTGGISWGNDGAGVTSTASNSCPLFTWTHFAASRVSGTLRLFINGSLVSTVSDSNNYNAADEFGIGKYSATNNWDGFISGVHVVVGTGLYTSNFTPQVIPTAVANTRLLLKFDNIGIHDAATKSPIVIYGDVHRSDLDSRYGLSSIRFPGNTSSYMQVINNANTLINPGSSDFTLEMWFKPLSETSMALMAYSSDFSLGMLFHFNGTRNLSIYGSSEGSSWNLFNANSGSANGTGTISMTVNAWNHVAMVRSGTTVRSFVNGVLDRTITGISGSIFTTNRHLRLGLWGNTTLPFNGYIDDFRFTVGFARYSGNFTPPTELPKY